MNILILELYPMPSSHPSHPTRLTYLQRARGLLVRGHLPHAAIVLGASAGDAEAKLVLQLGMRSKNERERERKTEIEIGRVLKAVRQQRVMN